MSRPSGLRRNCITHPCTCQVRSSHVLGPAVARASASAVAKLAMWPSSDWSVTPGCLLMASSPLLAGTVFRSGVSPCFIKLTVLRVFGQAAVSSSDGAVICRPRADACSTGARVEFPLLPHVDSTGGCACSATGLSSMMEASSSSVIWFQTHLACFFVHPWQAV